MLAPLDPYFRSGEINSEVSEPARVLRLLEDRYSSGKIDHLDGLTVNFQDWWFNCRPSNTQPLLRLNVEASSRELLEQKVTELLGVIRSNP